MALSLNITKTEKGFAGALTTNAYCRVDRLNGNKNSIRVSVGFYSQESRIDKQDYDFVPSLDGNNFIAQAYDYLKTLPEFAGATDC